MGPVNKKYCNHYRVPNTPVIKGLTLNTHMLASHAQCDFLCETPIHLTGSIFD